jgi:hypothetical protein
MRVKEFEARSVAIGDKKKKENVKIIFPELFFFLKIKMKV